MRNVTIKVCLFIHHRELIIYFSLKLIIIIDIHSIEKVTKLFIKP
jgi:hypothetical protein